MSSVVERLQKAAASVFAGEPVVFAYLFGSAARGDAGPRSDIDVAVHLESGVDPSHRLSLVLELAGALSKAAGLSDVEVVALNDAPLPLRGRIVRERFVVYSRDEPARVEFESLTLREFFDFQIHAGPLDEALLRRMAQGRR